MKKITILFISFFMAQMAFAQFMPQQNQHMNIDPARLYLQKMGKGKKDRTSKQEEVLDPLTKRRRQMRSCTPGQLGIRRQCGLSYDEQQPYRPCLQRNGRRRYASEGLLFQPLYGLCRGQQLHPWPARGL